MKFEQSICINTKYFITVNKFFYIIYSHSVIMDEPKSSFIAMSKDKQNCL